MHGRVKVKTTAEQDEEKRKEREKKLKLFQGASKKAFLKRENKEYDEEALNVTQQLLVANPDFYTIWNFRKEILQYFCKVKDEEQMQSLFSEELIFTEACLQKNPKSYGGWHHRRWVFNVMPKPDWNKELQLCNRYLELDERNFHCWDHRRHVVEKAEVSPAKELEFTMAKINANFSNYSSWHYRSKLLPLVFPDPDNKNPIDEVTHLQELDLVQSAAFTDPNDQSAWFYHRWLLGRGESPLSLGCVYANRRISKVLAIFTKPLSLSSGDTKLLACIDGVKFNEDWHPPALQDKYSTIWSVDVPYHLMDISKTQEVHVTMSSNGIVSELKLVLEKDSEEGWTQAVIPSAGLFSLNLSAATTFVLEQELESCQQLHELEPDNKWTLLTCVLIMRALNPHKYELETLTYLDTLIKRDPYRRNYYENLRSKFVLENAIENLSMEQREVSLSSLQLTTLYHLEHLALISKLDISSNKLQTLHQIYHLQCLRILIADENSICTCEGLQGLAQLEVLSLKNNHITDKKDLVMLFSCPNLQSVSLTGNPVCKSTDLEDWLKQNIPTLRQLQL